MGEKAAGNLNRHLKDKHEPNKQFFPCRDISCRAKFTRKAYRIKHEQKQHDTSFELIFLHFGPLRVGVEGLMIS